MLDSSKIPGYDPVKKRFNPVKFPKSGRVPSSLDEDCYGKYHEVEDLSCNKCKAEVDCAALCGTTPSAFSKKESTQISTSSSGSIISKQKGGARDEFSFKVGTYTNLLVAGMFENKWTWSQIVKNVLERKPGSTEANLNSYWKDLVKVIQKKGYKVSVSKEDIVTVEKA